MNRCYNVSQYPVREQLLTWITGKTWHKLSGLGTSRPCMIGASLKLGSERFRSQWLKPPPPSLSGLHEAVHDFPSEHSSHLCPPAVELHVLSVCVFTFVYGDIELCRPPPRSSASHFLFYPPLPTEVSSLYCAPRKQNRKNQFQSFCQ